MQRQQIGNPDLYKAIRVTLLTPVGKAAKLAEKRRFGKTRDRVVSTSR